MSSPRRGRLEALLGAPLAELSADGLRDLVDNAVREDVDLDFKAQLYGNGDSERRELAGDVGALANTVGGALILGILDEDGAAVDAPGVDLSDDEERQMTQVIASYLAPICQFGIHRIEIADHRGFYVIEVPRSVEAPHAVRVNEALRYPRRVGTTTRWLTETEVADAYRNRFTQAHAQVATLSSVYDDGVAGIERFGWDGETAWIAVAILPDYPGYLELVQTTPRVLADRLRQRQHPLVGVHSRIAYFDVHPTTGLRRVIVSQVLDHNTSRPRGGYWQLHTDGAAFGAVAVGMPLRFRGVDGMQLAEPFRFVVDDEELIIETAEVLDALIDHAIENCRSASTGILRAGILAESEEGPRPVALVHSRGLLGSLGRTEGLGTTDIPTSDHSIDMKACHDSPVDLLVATRMIVTDLNQALGRPECWQIDREGCLRRPYWSQQNERRVVPWAERVGVEVTTERVT